MIRIKGNIFHVKFRYNVSDDNIIRVLLPRLFVSEQPQNMFGIKHNRNFN